MNTINQNPDDANNGISWSDRNNAVLQHPQQSDRHNDALVIVSGNDTRLTDDHGNDYLDADAAGAVVQIGHGRKVVADRLADQMQTLEHFGVGGPHASQTAIELGERIMKNPPRGSKLVTFVSTGPEAIDEAVRLIREYHFRQGNKDRYHILSFDIGMHGPTIAGASLNGTAGVYGEGLTLAGFSTVPAPVVSSGSNATEEAIVEKALADLNAEIATVGADNIAAFVVEPVLRSGGATPLPTAYWAGLVAALEQHEILLVADETVTGFGRTGHWFGSHINDLAPDLTVVSNGIASGYMPLAGILFSERVAKVMADADTGGSYGGHTTACAAACASMDILVDENIVENAAKTGAYLIDKLNALRSLNTVLDVRGAGLMIGIDLAEGISAMTVADQLRRTQCVIVGIVGSSLSITPPLTLDQSGADEIATALHTVLSNIKF